MDERHLIIQPDGEGGITVTPETPISRALDILANHLRNAPLYQRRTRNQT